MALFKYTVANKEGKKLSGNVEAASEQNARDELNHLGFSILSIEKVETQQIAIKTDSVKFEFEAIDKSSRSIKGSILDKTKENALNRLEKEYELTILGIWKEGSSQNEIDDSKKERMEIIKKTLEEIKARKDTPDAIEESIAEAQSEDRLLKEKIENIIQQVFKLLEKYNKDIEKDQMVEINKKIDKLLRIKNSTNLDYIYATAEDLLNFIKSQENTLLQKGLQDKRFELRMETRSLIDELKQTQKPKSLSEDILNRINSWQIKHTETAQKKLGFFNTIINSLLLAIAKTFKTPPEIKAVKEEIKIYNTQIWELIKLYFKEPTPEYKDKIKQSIKGIWQARKKAKEKIKEIKNNLSQKSSKEKPSETKGVIRSIVEEISSFSGWILTFYMIYYFSAIYLTTKDFGLENIPKGFTLYDSHLFKYIFAIIFVLHISLAMKLNYFKNSKIASILLTAFFLIAGTIVIFNF